MKKKTAVLFFLMFGVSLILEACITYVPTLVHETTYLSRNYEIIGAVEVTLGKNKDKEGGVRGILLKEAKKRFGDDRNIDVVDITSSVAYVIFGNSETYLEARVIRYIR